MEFPRFARVTAGRLGWGLVVAGLAAGLAGGGSDAAGQDAQDDGIPSGTVAFFAGASCPPGWNRPDYAKGRMVVAVVDGGNVGVTVGTPLADRENRVHQHDYSVSVPLPSPAAGLVGASGGSIPGAQAQTYTVTGQSDPAPSDLPFVQLLACEKP
jgi:hypothetical protein